MRTTPRDTLTLASIHRSDASALRRPAPPPRASCEASRRASHVLRQACRCIRANSSRGARACSRHRADLGARSQVQPRDDSCRCSSARAHRALRRRTLRGAEAVLRHKLKSPTHQRSSCTCRRRQRCTLKICSRRRACSACSTPWIVLCGEVTGVTHHAHHGRAHASRLTAHVGQQKALRGPVNGSRVSAGIICKDGVHHIPRCTAKTSV